ncbi:ADP-ribosyl-[dinitrogen reductase] glycohydrolase-like [Littorina saxatilis]|uniref:ADP-ribosyl-[dinitrogen reductase] glycohydrolase-like n=1 Tax=Littorina saxatilis TaxID=31220 RepID=UPI0038B58B9F
MANSSASGDAASVKCQPPTAAELESRNAQITATIYGQCIGDAIGLLTEFLTKSEAKKNYKQKSLEYGMKIPDFHRSRWQVGDWTDDSDQMLLILLSLLDQRGETDVKDFAGRLKNWMLHGFPEFGDLAGMGIGATTKAVLGNAYFRDDPQKVAYQVWERKGGNIAPNGGVMRTSVVGTHCWWDTSTVVKNARDFVSCTHYDQRCQASAVSVSVCISLMLQRQPQHLDKKGKYNVDQLIKDTFSIAGQCLKDEEDKKLLWQYLSCKNVKELELDDAGKIGFTYKSMGAGFWALKQDDFRKAIQKVTMQGGDADSNACVAGAMLGCKLGMDKIPKSWKSGLIHKDWLDQHIERWLSLQAEMATKSSTVE